MLRSNSAVQNEGVRDEGGGNGGEIYRMKKGGEGTESCGYSLSRHKESTQEFNVYATRSLNVYATRTFDFWERSIFLARRSVFCWKVAGGWVRGGGGGEGGGCIRVCLCICKVCPA
jgi:hypothetical protein